MNCIQFCCTRPTCLIWSDSVRKGWYKYDTRLLYSDFLSSQSLSRQPNSVIYWLLVAKYQTANISWVLIQFKKKLKKQIHENINVINVWGVGHAGKRPPWLSLEQYRDIYRRDVSNFFFEVVCNVPGGWYPLSWNLKPPSTYPNIETSWIHHMGHMLCNSMYGVVRPIIPSTRPKTYDLLYYK